MSVKTFVDSNIWIYLLGNDLAKKTKAIELLQQSPVISTQVLSENANVCLKKLKLSPTDTTQHLLELVLHCELVEISSGLILDAVKVATQYKYSYYDSLIIATALHASCQILYSEDLQSGQVIYDLLKISDPFL